MPVENERVMRAAAKDAFLEYLRSDFDSVEEKLIFIKETLEIITDILTVPPVELKIIHKAAAKRLKRRTGVDL